MPYDSIKICEGLSAISDSYNGFLIDQWGTLHNGHEVFPDVLATLEELKNRGKKIILISNSGKRADFDAGRLKDLGVSPDLFDHIITSAETTFDYMVDMLNDESKTMGKKCFFLNRQGDESLVQYLEPGIEIVDDIDQADFVLLAGSDAPEKTLANYYDDILRKASRRQLKMICANPEKIVTVKGQNYMGSGQIAQRYEEFGGVVHYIGKPYPSIFNHAMKAFDGILPSQICMVGDNLAMDIRGANNVGIDSALIASGIHKGAFSSVKTTDDIRKILRMLGQNYGAVPTYFLPKFHWGKALPDRKNKKKKTK